MIDKKQTALLELLDLPDGSRLVAGLSGGQKRRLSFAVALLHEPKLLILDEPTVGVDPVVRARIWNHLQSLTESGLHRQSTRRFAYRNIFTLLYCTDSFISLEIPKQLYCLSHISQDSLAT